MVPLTLPCEVKPLDRLGFERMMQLHRWKIVVFDGISRTEDVQILETADFVQRLELHVPRKRGGETVEVIFVGRASLGFEKELVLLFFGKGA